MFVGREYEIKGSTGSVPVREFIVSMKNRQLHRFCY